MGKNFLQIQKTLTYMNDFRVEIWTVSLLWKYPFTFFKQYRWWKGNIQTCRWDRISQKFSVSISFFSSNTAIEMYIWRFPRSSLFLARPSCTPSSTCATPFLLNLYPLSLNRITCIPDEKEKIFSHCEFHFHPPVSISEWDPQRLSHETEYIGYSLKIVAETKKLTLQKKTRR